MLGDRYHCTAAYTMHGIVRLDYRSPYPVEEHIRYTNERVSINLVFINNTPEPLKVWWVDDNNPDEPLREQAVLPPYSQDATCLTFHTHKWTITTTVGGQVAVKEGSISGQDGHVQVWTVNTGDLAEARQKAGMQPVHAEQ